MGDTAVTETVDVGADWRGELARDGWVIVRGASEPEQAERALAELGPLREQYGGVLRHPVKAKPGFESLQYSQSQNGITPHTEAPGLPLPPRYLALHCRHQARCGGGRTLLADGYAMVEGLDAELQESVRTRPIRFDLVAGAGSDGAEPIAAPILAAPPEGDGPDVLRYSYNVLRDNSLNAPTHEDALDLDDVDPVNAALCRSGVEFMEEDGFGALPWDGDLLIFDNWRMIHARHTYSDPERHLTRYWVG